MDIERRRFLGLTAIGAMVPGVAWAQRRVLGGEVGSGPEIRVPGRVSPELRQFMGGVRLGPFAQHGSLAVIWLAADPPARPFEVLTLDEARGTGMLMITELDQARVPELVVENRGKTHVLLL